MDINQFAYMRNDYQLVISIKLLGFFMYGTSIELSLMTKAVFYAFGQIIALVADLLFSLAVALKSPTIVSTFWKRGLNAIRDLSFLAGIAGVGWKISSSVYHISLLFGPAKKPSNILYFPRLVIIS